MIYFFLFAICSQVKDMDGTSVFTSEEINKLKVCGKSFIMTVSLLRVIEMMISFDRNVIIDQEGSLGRVFQVIVMCKTFLFFFFPRFSFFTYTITSLSFQLICQILNRIRSSSSTFQQVIALSLPHVECVDQFTILAATVGFLLSILAEEIDEKGNSARRLNFQFPRRLYNLIIFICFSCSTCNTMV